MGPTLLFDKSVLQSLSVDEAVILDQMFACVISPLFFSETLGNLAKDPTKGRSPTSIIAELSTKTPVCHGYMNAFHTRLMVEELLGDEVPMDFRPMVAGGIPVRTDDGLGLVHKQSPEALAFERWQEQKFLEVERIAAKLWRQSLGEIDLPSISKSFRSGIKKEDRPKNQSDAWSLSRVIAEAPGQNYRTLLSALNLLDIPKDPIPYIIKHWKESGSRSLKFHAPFTFFCLRIDIYFYLCLANGIISDQRASNKIDMGYFYYAPFANIFVSSDKLHRSHATNLLKENQSFVWGPDLKADLKLLNEHFLGLPDEVKAQGLFTLAKHPPLSHDGVSARLWDQYRDHWRNPKAEPVKLPTDLKRKILRRGSSMIAAADMDDMPPPPRFAGGFGDEQFNHLIIQRAIPRVRGSWRMFSEVVEAAEDKRQKS